MTEIDDALCISAIISLFGSGGNVIDRNIRLLNEQACIW